jgi:predicted secreted protein
MMTEEERGQLKALAWRTLKAVDHIDAKAADEGLTISPEWRAWRSQVRAVIRGERIDIPDEPPRYVADAYKAHWDAVTSGTLAEAATAPVFEADPRDAEIEALRRRIAELEAVPVVEPSNPAEPPAEALEEAYPDEDHAALKARILGEFASLRNMLIGQIPMTHEQLDRLVALEHPKYQSWLQGVTK